MGFLDGLSEGLKNIKQAAENLQAGLTRLLTDQEFRERVKVRLSPHARQVVDDLEEIAETAARVAGEGDG